MTASDLLPAAATVALALWFLGVTGWVGFDPTVNWVLFVAGLVLAAAAPLVRPRSSAPAPARP
ncbi:MAG TPA: hypothetical protein VLK36_02940 [Gaiellaceae bacterium]|nr:hypothetical protein [Gaiellaceae bacterium]